MKFSSLLLAVLACGFVSSIRAATPPDTPELAQLRADLLADYKRGLTDEHPQVKQLRSKIAALEYVAEAEAKPANAGATVARFINVDFPGGPFSALIAAINKEGAGLNVVGEKTDLATNLPPFQMRNADHSALAGALGELLRARGLMLQTGSRNAPAQAAVYVLRKLNASEAGNYVQFQSFQLGPYLEYQSVDDILSAIRAAWELDPAHVADALRLKFHPGTGILLLSAPPEGVQIMQSVLQQLRRAPVQNNVPTPKPPASPAAEKK